VPRALPPLAADLSAEVIAALRLADAGEIALAESPRASKTSKAWHFTRIELLYELAFLKVFIGWETFLEQTFVRFLCGYTSSNGLEPLVAKQSYQGSLAAAATTVLGGQQYVLWHNPTRVVQRCAKFFAAGRIETVVNSNFSRLEWMGSVRHQIAHGNADTGMKFDVATMQLIGKRYPGSRAGRFLRDIDVNSTPPTRWLTVLSNEIEALGQQIV
jgi:hypothetical protein